MKVIYIAGPFRAANAWLVAENVHRAEQAAHEVVKLGAMPLTPHSIGARMDGTATAQFWISGTLELMRRCDAVLVLPGYGNSEGTKGEIAEAERMKLPIFLPHCFGDGEHTFNDYTKDRFYDRREYALQRLKEWLTKMDGIARGFEGNA